jgi:hypothetical protein
MILKGNMSKVFGECVKTREGWAKNGDDFNESSNALGIIKRQQLWDPDIEWMFEAVLKR